jgi:CHAT domain-containing protein
MDRQFSGKKKGLILVFITILLETMLMITNSYDCRAETIDQLRAAREEYVEHFRTTGELDAGKAKAIENSLKSLEESSHGKLLAQVLFELATIQRITNQFGTAIGNYERAAIAAKEIRDTDIEFDAWIGLARSHAYGTRNHGAAAAAFERAIASAGDNPGQRQRYEMADYSSQLQAGRGELESALLNALEAVKLAQDNSQRFYALLDAGDILRKFADSCDYRKLIDAKSNSETDPWGACKRAVESARSNYEKARITADKSGWESLKRSMEYFFNLLDVRLILINQKANIEQSGQMIEFDGGQVLVNENFYGGALDPTSAQTIGALIEQILPGSQAEDPRSVYLRGIKAELDGYPEKALEYFKNAAKLLGTERDSLFDIQQRGTVVENSPEYIQNLGLRLLALRKNNEAFVVFESLRSRGLEWLATAFDKGNFTDSERRWIANLVQLDSLISAKQNALVETAIAGIEHSRSFELLDELNQLEQRRLEQQNEKQFQSVVKRLKSIECEIPTVTQLKTIVDKVKIPVLLYWVTTSDVVVWVVSPKGVEVKTVFLPEVAVVDKVSKLRDSCKTMNQAFDDKSAKELYSYLIKPFVDHLSNSQVIIIPQGPLVGLPFEAMIDSGDGKYLAEKLSISYAPNAAFAMRALRGRLPGTPKITAIYDDKIENETHEISRMKDIKDVVVSPHSSKSMDATKMVRLLGVTGIVHVLLHGMYDYDDPLQSTIRIGGEENQHGGSITAADLLAADWCHTQLAVFSSCEGAVVKTRISNEQFGISWALLAGGADHVVLSRWRVNGASNAAWMETFYKGLLVEKMSPALAANVAMRRLIRSDKAHPYYWAGPQVFGR